MTDELAEVIRKIKEASSKSDVWNVLADYVRSNYISKAEYDRIKSGLKSVKIHLEGSTCECGEELYDIDAAVSCRATLNGISFSEQCEKDKNPTPDTPCEQDKDGNPTWVGKPQEAPNLTRSDKPLPCGACNHWVKGIECSFGRDSNTCCTYESDKRHNWKLAEQDDQQGERTYYCRCGQFKRETFPIKPQEAPKIPLDDIFDGNVIASIASITRLNTQVSNLSKRIERLEKPRTVAIKLCDTTQRNYLCEISDAKIKGS